MTDPSALRDDLLMRRLELVAKVSGLTADALRLHQKFAGAEIEVLRLELDIGRAGPGELLVRDLHLARKDAEAIEAERVECDERVAAVEAEIEDLDRRLAAADGSIGERP